MSGERLVQKLIELKKSGARIGCECRVWIGNETYTIKDIKYEGVEVELLCEPCDKLDWSVKEC